ncbi:MAG: DUF7144 family membrane protein [Solirubrobacteraceae bacterium]
MDETKGLGRAIFAATFLLIGCVLNVIYGIAAISNSHFFTQHSHYVFGDLKTWGWVTLIIGVLEGFAGVSLFQGGTYGRWFAILAASLAAIGALLDLPAAPFWSLAVFALSLWIIHGLVLYGETSPDKSGDYPVASDTPRERVGGRS